MNKTKISSKVKFLALLYLYTTIGLGGASIVSSCGSENAPAENDKPKLNTEGESLNSRGAGINDFEKIKADLEKKEIDAIKAKDKAINDKKAVETENTKLKEEKTILSKKAIIKDVLDTFSKLNDKIDIALVVASRCKVDGTLQTVGNNINFKTANIVLSILSGIINLLDEKGEESLTDIKIANCVYDFFEEAIKAEVLAQFINKNEPPIVIFIDNTAGDAKKNLIKNIIQCKVTTSNKKEIVAPVLICIKDTKESNVDDEEKNSLIVVPTNSPKEIFIDKFIKILKGIRTGCE